MLTADLSQATQNLAYRSIYKLLMKKIRELIDISLELYCYSVYKPCEIATEHCSFIYSWVHGICFFSKWNLNALIRVCSYITHEFLCYLYEWFCQKSNVSIKKVHLVQWRDNVTCTSLMYPWSVVLS